MADEQNRPIHTIRVSDFKRIYANTSSIRVSPLDVTILFGFQGEIEVGVDGVQELMSVTMSHQHLSVFMAMLQQTVQQAITASSDPTAGISVSVNTRTNKPSGKEKND